MSLDVVALFGAAVAAGWVDAVVGGGGLIMIPALLITTPGLAPATALGTNKLMAIFGTLSAAWRYSRRVPMDVRRLAPVFLCAVVFSALGALVAALLPADVFTPIVLVLLVVVGVFVAFNPRFGSHDVTGKSRRSIILGLSLIHI